MASYRGDLGDGSAGHAALAIALVTAWWWHADGFGWLATIAAGIVAYVFWKIAIAVAIGRYQGAMLRSQIDAVADVLANKQRPNESADDFKK